MSRILVIRQHYYPQDPRVRREVKVLVQLGHEVDIICLARAGERPRERCDGVNIRRISLRRHQGGTARYLLEYGAFGILAAVLAGWLQLRQRYDLVQVNSIPDTLIFAAVVPRLLGVPVLLDLHECMPEFFATKFRTGLAHPAVRAIAACEQASIRFASFAITCTRQMREVFITRGAPGDKIGVIVNGADEECFAPQQYATAKGSGHFTLICHGAIEERYGLDTAIRAVGLVKGDIPGVRLEIYGEGSYRGELQRLARDLGVERHVWFSDGFAPIGDLVAAIAAADVGVVAMKRDVFRDLTLCNKMFDFIAMGKPILMSRTRAVAEYFGADCFQFFTADDERDLARAIRELHADPDCGPRLAARAAEANEPNRWQHQGLQYAGIVTTLLRAHQEASSRSARRSSRRFATLAALALAMSATVRLARGLWRRGAW